MANHFISSPTTPNELRKVRLLNAYNELTKIHNELCDTSHYLHDERDLFERIKEDLISIGKVIDKIDKRVKTIHTKKEFIDAFTKAMPKDKDVNYYGFIGEIVRNEKKYRIFGTYYCNQIEFGEDRYLQPFFRFETETGCDSLELFFDELTETELESVFNTSNVLRIFQDKDEIEI